MKERVFGRLYGRDFWALQHCSFDVRRGERFGVIGRNGSGKSTLLEIIAGTLAPTAGDVETRGHVAALLELGSGFNPEFTGRENVMLNGAIQGVSRAEMEAWFDDIAAFADIGPFIDQPVKLYSSGMFVRLAFAVGTSIDADVLLIGEALAVGDVFFRQKCYRRLEALRERETAIILVSHGLGDVEQFCDRALLLDHGETVFLGAASEAVKRYYLVESRERLEATSVELVAPATAPGLPRASWPESVPKVAPDGAQVTDGLAQCTAVAVCDAAGRACHVFEQGRTAVFWSEYDVRTHTAVPIAGLVIHSDKGTAVHGKTTLEYATDVPDALAAGTRVRVRHEIALELAPGEYTFEIGLSMVAGDVYRRRDRIPHIELASAIVRLVGVPVAGQFAVVFRRPGAGVQLLHHGVANLPGRMDVAAEAPAGWPTMTVITPSYNQGKFIARTVERVVTGHRWPRIPGLRWRQH